MTLPIVSAHGKKRAFEAELDRQDTKLGLQSLGFNGKLNAIASVVLNNLLVFYLLNTSRSCLLAITPLYYLLFYLIILFIMIFI